MLLEFSFTRLLFYNVNELTTLVEGNVVVTDAVVLGAIDLDLVLFLRKLLGHLIVADSNRAFCDEVHVSDLVFFIQNQFVFFCEDHWFETEANLIEELCVLLFCGLEEGPEPVDDVVEDVVEHQVVSHFLWALIEILVVYLKTTQSIVSPVVRPMPIYLVNQSLRQRLTCEPDQEGHPIREVCILLVFPCDSVVVVLDDFDEGTHNLGEEYDTNKHEYNSHKHFRHTNWVEIAVANS